MRAMTLTLAAFVMLAAGGALWGGGQSEKELKKIQGTWKFISQEMDGKAKPKEDLAKLQITFTGDKWSVTDDGKVVQAGTHTLDPSKKPNQVDAKVTEGEDKGSMMLGIYELKGNTLKVCFDPSGKERPTSFTAKAGQFSAVVERATKKS